MTKKARHQLSARPRGHGPLRLCAGFALALLVALVGILPPPARSAGGLSMVICTSEGLVRITLASDPGAPPDHSRHCPDCVLTLAAVVPDGSAAAAIPVQPAHAGHGARRSLRGDGIAGNWADARGPPAPV